MAESKPDLKPGDTVTVQLTREEVDALRVDLAKKQGGTTPGFLTFWLGLQEKLRAALEGSDDA